MTRDARAAGRAVSARMAELGLTATALAKKAGVDAKTLRDLVSGARWPHHATRGRIESALDWPYGAIEEFAEKPSNGEPGATVGPTTQDADRVSLDLGDAVDGLSPTEREEVALAARLAALQKAREIRGRG